MIFTALISFQVVAQSNIRLNNYWENMQYINPASVYDKYLAVFSMAARKQWLGIDGAPTTFFGAGSVYLEDYHTQLALNVFQDKIGYTYTTNANFSYAYVMSLNYNWQLHLGAGIDYQAFYYDLSMVNLSSALDNVPAENLTSASRLNADVGIELSGQHWKMGAASQNILSLIPSDRPLQTNTNFAYVKYNQASSNIVNFGAGICGIQYSNMLQAEASITTFFKFDQYNGLTDKPDLFSIGFFYRTGSQTGFIFGLNITDAIHISYSYDYHFGGIRYGSFGTNEVILTYNLKKKPVCHNCWY